MKSRSSGVAARIVPVKLEDAATGATLELPLDAADDPLDVFDHPYAYAAARGLDLDNLGASP